MSYLSRLIENRKRSIDFDLTKSFHENANSFQTDIEDNPINPVDSNWEEINHNNQTFLKKTYIFKETQHLLYFINECIKKSEEENYYPELFLKEKNVKIFLKNDLINQIDETDMSFSKFLDEIYEDIFYI